MNLLYTIKQTLEHTNHDELLKTMNYHNLKIGHKTLQKFLETDDIYLFLKNGSYDLKYNSEEFLQHLLKDLDLASVVKDKLKKYNRHLDDIRAMRNIPYIYIDTHFKRKGEPLHVLAMVEGRRNIYIDKELLVFKSESGVLDMIGDIVKKHYLESEGNIPLWGKAYNYVYHHTDGSKYIFDTDGTLPPSHSEISESRAELKIGNRKLNSIE